MSDFAQVTGAQSIGQATSDQLFRFLDLPLELRDEVYSILLVVLEHKHWHTETERRREIAFWKSLHSDPRLLK